MPTLKIISDNAGNRSVTTASTTAGTMVAANLAGGSKSQVWRSTGTTATLTCVWPAGGETLAGVVLPNCNLTQVATMRVQLFSDVAGTVQIFDSGALYACPAVPIKVSGFTALQSQSAYAYGGGACARLWFSAVTGVANALITLTDTGNAQGYIEASRLVIGNAWVPLRNVDYGAAVTTQDTSKAVRSEGGDLIHAAGTRNRKLSFTLTNLQAADRTALVAILRSVGITSPIFVSLFSGSTDNELERDHSVWGCVDADTVIAIPFYNGYSAPCTLVEV